MSSTVTAQLILIQGDSQSFQRVIELRSRNVSIGRAQNCDVIWGSLQISRRHATLEYVISKWYIRDTSTNGLSVNGTKLVKGELFQLKDADMISFIPTGSVRYRFKHVLPNSPYRPLVSSGQSSSISPQPSSSNTATPSSSNRLANENARLGSSSELPSLDSSSHSDSEGSNHSASLLSLENNDHDDYFSFSGDERDQSLFVDRSEGGVSPVFSKRKHRGDSSDSDSNSVDRKKKKTQFSLSSDDDYSHGSDCDKSEHPSTSSDLKTLRLPKGMKLMSEDQINRCNDLKSLKEHLRLCMAQFASSEVKVKALEIERNMEREEFRRKETDVDSLNDAIKEETYRKILEMMESELSCAVCNEIFIQATVVDCGHTFCNFCINEWARKKQECPICRKAFRNRSRHIEMENYVTKIYDLFPSEIAVKRKASIKDREDQTKKAAEDAAKAATDNQGRGAGGGNFHAFIQTTAERYVDFLAELHQINEILAPRPSARGNGSGSSDRRRSARIQERVIDTGVGAAAQGPSRGRHRGRGRNPAGASNTGTGVRPTNSVAPLSSRALPNGIDRQNINLNPIPVVTLNDSNEDGAAPGPLRFPNQFINYVRRFPVHNVNLIDGRNVNGTANQ